MPTEKWRSALNSAATCEVFWRSADGEGHAIAATPLLWQDQPTLAFTYADATTARSIAGAQTVAISVSDPRLSAEAWQPLTIVGRPQLTEDTSGDHFGGSLLVQELRKYPPSRALAESPALRREHWWYVLRLLVTVQPTGFTQPAPRRGGVDAVLASFGDDLHITTVTMLDSDGDAIAVQAIDDRRLPDAGQAVLLQHDFSHPDRERATRLVVHGHFDGDTFKVTSRTGGIRLPRPLSSLARARRRFQLSRECRKALSSVS